MCSYRVKWTQSHITRLTDKIINYQSLLVNFKFWFRYQNRSQCTSLGQKLLLTLLCSEGEYSLFLILIGFILNCTDQNRLNDLNLESCGKRKKITYAVYANKWLKIKGTALLWAKLQRTNRTKTDCSYLDHLQERKKKKIIFSYVFVFLSAFFCEDAPHGCCITFPRMQCKRKKNRFH